MKDKVYQRLASLVVAYKNCEKNDNDVWKNEHNISIDKIMETSPSGSGFDNGTSIDIEESDENKLVFYTEFHHMEEHGYYAGWTDHKIIVEPNLVFDFVVIVEGDDVNYIKEYIEEVFCNWLNTNVVI